jgi:enoyl-CoA hydratase
VTDDVIGVEVADAVGVLRISRPHRRNALNLGAVEAIDDAIGALADVRCLVLTGDGGHFCAGADLTELEDLTFTNRLRAMLDHLAGLPFTTIAAIDGSCMGLGVQLAIACDVRIATPTAQFAVPVAKLGLMVDHWTIRRLVATLGASTTRHLVLTAAVLSGEDAHRLGFVAELGDLSAALELAHRVRHLAPLSIAGSKLGVDLVVDQPPDPAYVEAFRRAWESEDLVEGRAAFAERRAPVFRGR